MTAVRHSGRPLKTWIAALTLSLALPVALEAPAVAKKSVKSAGAKHAPKHRAKRRGRMAGHGIDKSELRTEPLPKPSGDIWVWSPNFREEVRVNIYTPDGSFDQAALAALDHGFRCKRTDEERAVDPRLYEVLSIIQDHFGGKRIELTSGFRFQQNEGSRHFHASAMDIRVDGVPMRELWDFAQTLDRGGMGIGKYPRAGFVHVDFRAPGEPSYRWTDNSRGDGRGRGKAPSRAARPSS